VTDKDKTSVTVYTEDLKWLKKRKIEGDHKTLAEAFNEVRNTMEEK
jgi:hypothetical protein